MVPHHPLLRMFNQSFKLHALCPDVMGPAPEMVTLHRIRDYMGIWLMDSLTVKYWSTGRCLKDPACRPVSFKPCNAGTITDMRIIEKVGEG